MDLRPVQVMASQLRIPIPVFGPLGLCQELQDSESAGAPEPEMCETSDGHA